MLFKTVYTHTAFFFNPLLTTDDEVGVEDAQGGLVGALLVINRGGDDEAERDAGDSLQHDQDYDQHQGAFIRHLQRKGVKNDNEPEEDKVVFIDKAAAEKSMTYI